MEAKLYQGPEETSPLAALCLCAIAPTEARREGSYQAAEVSLSLDLAP